MLRSAEGQVPRVAWARQILDFLCDTWLDTSVLQVLSQCFLQVLCLLGDFQGLSDLGDR